MAEDPSSSSAADEKARRVRSLLSSYYGSSSGGGGGGGGGGGPSGAASSAPAIDTATFDPDGYVNRLVKETRLDGLQGKCVEMASEIKSLDSDMQMLVYENYSKFITATDTIRRMKSNVEGMEVRARAGEVMGTENRERRDGEGWASFPYFHFCFLTCAAWLLVLLFLKPPPDPVVIVRVRVCVCVCVRVCVHPSPE